MRVIALGLRCRAGRTRPTFIVKEHAVARKRYGLSIRMDEHLHGKVNTLAAHYREPAKDLYLMVCYDRVERLMGRMVEELTGKKPSGAGALTLVLHDEFGIEFPKREKTARAGAARRKARPHRPEGA